MTGPEDPDVQCASYALELLSFGGWRSHVIGAALIVDNGIRLIYYDHSAIVKSELLDWFRDPIKFISVIYGLTRLSREEWGFHPLVRLEPPIYPSLSRNKEAKAKGKSKGKGRGKGKRKGKAKDEDEDEPEAGKAKLNSNIYHGIRVKLDDGKLEPELQDVLHDQDCIIGRGTCVVNAKVVAGTDAWEKLKGENVVVKLSWPSETRVGGDLRSKAHDQAGADVLECPDGPDMAEHLPEILHCEDYHTPDGEISVQTRLSKIFGGKYEKRVLRILVQSPLERLTVLTNAKETYDVFHDIFTCESTDPSSMLGYRCRYQDGKLIENPPFEDWAGDHIEALRKNKNSFMARGNNITPTPHHKPLFRLMVKLKEALHNGVIACEATGDDGEIAELSPKDHLTLCGHFSFDAVEEIFEKFASA
ncbi:hypothetical protein EUX98_g6075 [Antrodiella citrinella]|uniref:Fungal-type protein kinase domain-containing protein n=1 Tax=Antrodiella citrinella TaxID=2447956 RepID=A0A4S4MQ27_9APHY|nr:hypothetical protein EUX98_g6075 [Antrodiella citrinella]